MTGPEHYAEAERLLEVAAAAAVQTGRAMSDASTGLEDRRADAATGFAAAAALTAQAQVHATLALAAATDRGLARMRPGSDGLASG